MEFLPEQLEQYIENHTSEESTILKALDRETHLKVLMPQMLSGKLQGRVLSMFSKMIAPQHILEIGTFTGYSAICMAEGLQKGGKLITIDINEELRPMVDKAIHASGMSDKIVCKNGNALEIIPKLTEMFELVFIDADKVNYSNYYDLVFPKVRHGGYIIADNVLWSGKVLDAKQDKDTEAIVAFNEKIQNDDRIENVLFPVRDGLMVMRKKLEA